MFRWNEVSAVRYKDLHYCIFNFLGHLQVEKERIVTVS